MPETEKSVKSRSWTDFWIGTSGFAYREWRGKFYPERLPLKEMLRFYAQRFSAVEINATFYRMPSDSALASWMSQVPQHFRFALKAPSSITHRRCLHGVAEETAAFISRASLLESRLGPLLFQFPPSLPRNLPLLRAFLDPITSGRIALEFRHPSWFDDDIYTILRERGAALCISDRDNTPPPPLVATASFAYVRLRRSGYSDDDLLAWRENLERQGWDEIFTFFRHEETGMGTVLAERMLRGVR